MGFKWFDGATRILLGIREKLSAQLTTLEALNSRVVSIEAKLAANKDATDLLLNELEFIRKRHSVYVGDGSALAYLVDQTPIYVNANDAGPAASILNGGVYEPENIEVILSFVKPETVFLDIGANIGIFSLYVGKRLKRNGRVYAFEPQQKLVAMLKRSAFINGIGDLLHPGIVTCFAVGASDQNRSIGFFLPDGHLAGGAVSEGNAENSIEVVRLDDFLGADFRCDLVKMDVESHELAALSGMTRIITNSPCIKILFEKLGKDVGSEERLESFFADRGMALWGVVAGAVLAPLKYGELAKFDGYVVAARAGDQDMAEPHRGRFTIYPSQLSLGRDATIVGDRLEATARAAEVLFHGPYWFLARGQYRMRLHGSMTGRIQMTIASRFGYPLTGFEIRDASAEVHFTIDRDAVLFECVARAAGRDARVSLERIEIIRGWN
jgi:FkbM family methyltransferase